MTVTDVMVDSLIYLGFYVFGMASGLFVFWLETRTMKRR